MRNGCFVFLGIALAVGASLLASAEPVAGMESRSLPQIRAASAIMSATDFLDVCRSADAEKSSYCNGYLRGAVFFWQEITACRMNLHSTRSFCDGAKDARTKVAEVMAASKADQKAPADPNSDKEKTLREMREKVGTCVPGADHGAMYCQAYNTRAEFAIVAPFALSRRGPDEGPDRTGLLDAVGSEFPFLFASKEAYQYSPCLSPDFTVAKARAALLAFIRAHPEQQKGLNAFELIGRALYFTVCPAQANMRPNMEQCLEWASPDGTHGAKNTCGEAITIRFMTVSDEHIIEATVQPDEFFRSGLTLEQAKSARWLFTACPKSSAASVGFNAADPDRRAKDRRDIIDGLYECIMK